MTGDTFVDLSLFVLLFACLLILAAVIKAYFDRVIIFEYERGIRYHKGKFTGILKPGAYWSFRFNSLILKADTRPMFLTIPGQEILTDGNISVKISLLVKYRIADLEKAYVKSSDWHEAMYAFLQLNLRRFVASLPLDELLKNRSDLIENLLAEATGPLSESGIELISVDVKDIMLSADIKKAYTQILLAKQDGLAALEKARGETAALRNLANAAKILENNPALYQLRLLQSLSETKGSTLVLGTQGLITSPVVKE